MVAKWGKYHYVTLISRSNYTYAYEAYDYNRETRIRGYPAVFNINAEQMTIENSQEVEDDLEKQDLLKKD